MPGNYLASMSRMLCCQRKISWHILSEREDDIPMLSKKIMHFLKGLEKLPSNVHRFLSLYGCLTRNGNYRIHEFDCLKLILTAV